MRKLYILIAFLFCAGSALAQEEWTTRIYLTNSFGDNRNDLNISLGVKKDATDTLDAALGEQELPPVHPPGATFHAYVYFPDTIQRHDIIHSYKDFRSIPADSAHYYREYRLWIQWGGAEWISIGWDNLPKTVDSAYLTDIQYGIIYKFNLRDSLRAVINNSAHTRFILQVWLNKGDISVPESNETVTIYPTPANDDLNVTGLPEAAAYELLDSFGRSVAKGETQREGRIDISSLPSSVYFMRFHLKNGEIITKKFTKI